MGTHPIFESDFDCLTENWQTRKIGFSLATFSSFCCRSVLSIVECDQIASFANRAIFEIGHTVFVYSVVSSLFPRGLWWPCVCPTHNNDDSLFLCRLGTA